MAIIFLRSFPALIAVLVIVHIEGAWRRLATRRPLAQLLRGGLMILSYWLFLQALTGGLHFALAVGLVFAQDYVFGSPSTAAGVILVRSANGRELWKADDGRMLKQVQATNDP